MPVRVSCPECDSELSVPDQLAGKTVRCPRCKNEFVAHELESALPARSSRRHDDAADDDDSYRDDRFDRDEDRPRRGRRRRNEPAKSRSGLIIGLVLAGVLLIVVMVGGIGFAVYKAISSEASIPDSQWADFQIAEANCGVLMPGSPTLDNSGLPGVKGKKYILERKADNLVFVLAYFELPLNGDKPSLLEDMANAERDAVGQAMKAKVKSESSINLGPIPGREIIFEINKVEGGAIERIYMDKTKDKILAYIVMVGGRGIEPKKGIAAKFLNSFRINSDNLFPNGFPDMEGPPRGGRGGRGGLPLPGGPGGPRNNNPPPPNKDKAK